MDRSANVLLTKLMLSLDKYIDVNYQRKAIYMAVGIGIAAFLVLTWLTYIGKVDGYITILIKLGAGLWLLLLETTYTPKKTDRHYPSWIKIKHKFGCRCSKEYLPIYGQKSWMKDRFDEHYTCLVFPFTAWFLAVFTICNLIVYFCNQYLLKYLIN